MKITKEQYEQLPDFMKANFVLGDDGDYVSKDDGALKRAKDHEVERRKEEVKKRKALEQELQSYKDKEENDSENAAKNKGDVEALEKSYKDKIAKLEAKKDGRISNLEGQLSSLLVDNVAMSVAESISTSPKLLVPFIKQRLTADLEGDKPTTRILDSEGQISALSIDELKAEFQANDDFKPVLIASKASGGAESKNPSSSPSFSTSGGGADNTSLSDMGDEQLAARITQLREERKQ